MSDWIKLRCSIASDPKVLQMAEFLLGNQDFRGVYESVTRDVTPLQRVAQRHSIVCVTVVGLLHVWGVARRQGRVSDENKEDIVVDHMTHSSIDQIACVPGFSCAMELVDWVRFVDANKSAVFPKFLSGEASERITEKSPAAIRQKRYRDKKKLSESIDATQNPSVTNVTESVTRYVTSCATLSPSPSPSELTTSAQQKRKSLEVKTLQDARALGVGIPDQLTCHSTFEPTFDKWLASRSNKHLPMNTNTVEASISKCAKWLIQNGIDFVIDILNDATEGEWKNLVAKEPRNGHGGNGRGKGKILEIDGPSDEFRRRRIEQMRANAEAAGDCS